MTTVNISAAKRRAIASGYHAPTNVDRVEANEGSTARNMARSPGGLLKYYEDNVIGGPGAFALAADTHEAFPASVLSKLIKEIALGPHRPVIE